MSGNFWLDGSILAISIFNIVLMLWLGLMVILSAEKRSTGVYLAGGGLIAGSVFFLSHAALIGQNIALFSTGVNFWWHLGWAPVVAAPFAWYVVMLWFSGYWSERGTTIRTRHRGWFYITIVYAVLLFFLFIFANPFGDLTRGTTLSYEDPTSFTRLPLLFIAYPLFILLCIVLSMDALLRPAPSQRMMGEYAREKARPWLIGSGFLLLVSALVVGYTLGWVSSQVQQQTNLVDLYADIAATLAWVDLALSVLITIAVVLVGQAIVSYEVFTGKPMPSSGFKSQFITILIIAGGLSILTSLLFQLDVKRIYLLLFSILLTAGLFAFFTWQVNKERERTLGKLRDLLQSSTLSDSIISSHSAAEIQKEMSTDFERLIRDVLGLDAGMFIPAYSNRLFDLSVIVYPHDLQVNPETISDSLLENQHPINELNLIPDESNPLKWYAPVSGEHGVEGWLVMGNKSNGGFITQEEIDLGRSALERMVAAWISASLSRKLVLLQRERITEQILLEQRPRRIIHDDVLPLLHAALLHASPAGEEQSTEMVTEITRAHKTLSDLLRQMPSYRPEQFSTVPLDEMTRNMLDREFTDSFSETHVETDDHFRELEQKCSTTQKEILYYAIREAIRNAARHAQTGDPVGLPTVSVNFSTKNGLSVEISDNGIGSNIQAVTSSGSGQGLLIHSMLVSIAGGKMEIITGPGQSGQVKINLPVYE